jgi:membrane-associated phospholipid phosphatase
MAPRQRVALVLGIFSALSLAAVADRPVARALANPDWHNWIKSHQTALDIIKFPGDFRCTAMTALLVAALHRRHLRGAAFHLASGAAGLLNSLVKWSVGRSRPFRLPGESDRLAPFVLHPFRGGPEGLFNQSNLAFTSGHACIAFAAATALALLFPRWRWVFYAVAAAVGLERLSENAHYVSDIVGAAILAICVVHILWYLLRGILKLDEPAAAPL